jgi:hypothetical protein
MDIQMFDACPLKFQAFWFCEFPFVIVPSSSFCSNISFCTSIKCKFILFLQLIQSHNVSSQFLKRLVFEQVSVYENIGNIWIRARRIVKFEIFWNLCGLEAWFYSLIIKFLPKIHMFQNLFQWLELMFGRLWNLWTWGLSHRCRPIRMGLTGAN